MSKPETIITRDDRHGTLRLVIKFSIFNEELLERVKGIEPSS